MEKLIRTTVLMNMAQGNFGNSLITDTNLRTGNWQTVYALSDVVIDVLTIENADDSFSGITLYSGMQISGHITEIKLLSGVLIAYKRGAA